MQKKYKKIAIVTDWLTTYGGAEKVVKTISDIFPEAIIYTSQYSKKEVDWFNDKKIKVGWLNVFPAKLRKILGPLRVIYFNNLDLSEYDLIISVSCGESKGIKTSKNQLHISYLQGPPVQYYWGMYEDYLKNPGFGIFNFIVRFFFKILVLPLRKIDFKFAQRPDLLLANSKYSQDEIKKYYKRESEILYPPVEVEKFPLVEKKEEYYITTSRQVNWKKLDIAIEAFKANKKDFILVGGGAEHDKLVNMAKGYENIKFINFISNPEELAIVVAKAKGFIFPSLEPFGIAPVESLASGTPVIAYNKGGSRDYIIENENGIFFEKQTSKNLLKAIEKFENCNFSSRKVSRSVKKFSTDNFISNLNKIIKEANKNENKT